MGKGQSLHSPLGARAEAGRSSAEVRSISPSYPTARGMEWARGWLHGPAHVALTAVLAFLGFKENESNFFT